VFTPAIRYDAVRSFKRRLRAVGSPLATSPHATEQLIRQVNSVLDDVEATLHGAVVPGGDARRLSSEIGTYRAIRGVHPVTSLRAAAVMFEVLLPIVQRELRARRAEGQTLLTAAGALNESITYRIGLGAVSYASFLRTKVNVANRDERRRIGRELHDRAAHSVGVALQDLDLHDAFAGSDPGRAERSLEAARSALREALDLVRELAEELRESPVGAGGLEKALARYLNSSVSSGIGVTMSVSGAGHLPDEMCEELYFVLREAVRNAVLHAHPSALEVTVSVQDGEIRAAVHDDGTGFDVARSLAAGIGLASMRERVELLGGTLAITSTPARGTTVSLRITHPESNR
jgi:signal transduction histidine kinase